ncbi:plancitoxin-1-like [Ptychodera flava]|uniref:plancitoxin-1-like n=1 Tax=Ptychodera flava TaxID=63121 RepID=UPI00396A7D71
MLKFVVFVVCLFVSACAAISCKDDQGKNVDWFIIYKVPKILKSKNELMRAGVAYYYFDPSVQTGRLSTVGIDSPNQALAKTLNQIYSNHKSKSVAYLMYSDSWPHQKAKSNRGHTKGDVCLDKTSGFWLVHSVPQFPEYSNRSYLWPSNAKKNGQSLFCVSASVQSGSFRKIATALQYNWPWVYDYNVPDDIDAKVPALLDIANGQHIDVKEGYQDTFTSLAGQVFTVFGKGGKFNDDLYSNLVAPYFKQNMFTETWQVGPSPKMESYCHKYKIENIKNVSLPGVKFPSTLDHSKWAITYESAGGQVCMGDINRQLAQKSRGGGMLCTRLPKLWKKFTTFVEEIENCHRVAWNF